jgi:hypothetical protein
MWALADVGDKSPNIKASDSSNKVLKDSSFGICFE